MIQTLREINLLQGVTAKNLTLPPMRFEISVEIDDLLAKLIKDGKESLRWQALQDAAEKAAEPVKKIIKEEITRLDAKVKTLSAAERTDMVDTVNKTLKQIGEAQKGAVQKAVDNEWEAAVRRSKTLAKYNRKVYMKYVMGTIAIAAAVVSVAATGGAAIIAAAGILKAAAEIAITYSDSCQKIDEAADELEYHMDETRDNLDKEIKSRGRQVLSDLSPVIGKFMTTIKTCDQNQVKLEAKIGAAEGQADTLVGQLNAGLQKLDTVQTAQPEQVAYIKSLRLENKSLLKQVSDSYTALKGYIKFNENARTEIKTWKAKRLYGTKYAIQSGTLGKLAVAIGTVARISLKLAGIPCP